jgi:hypothetical protein
MKNVVDIHKGEDDVAGEPQHAHYQAFPVVPEYQVKIAQQQQNVDTPPYRVKQGTGCQDTGGVPHGVCVGKLLVYPVNQRGCLKNIIRFVSQPRRGNPRGKEQKHNEGHADHGQPV